RGASREHGLGVAARSQHRRLEVHVEVHEPRRDETTRAVEYVERVGARPRRVDAGDQRPDDADIGPPELTYPHVDNRAAGQQQIERRVAPSGSDGTTSDRRLHRIGLHQLWRPFTVVLPTAKTRCSWLARKLSRI